MEYEYLFSDRKRIGENIVALMKDRHCTKVTLSQALNVSRPTLDAFLKGEIHNAAKYDQYVGRLLAYMQITDTVLCHYQELPDSRRVHKANAHKEEAFLAIQRQRIPMVSGGSELIKQRVASAYSSGQRVFVISWVSKNAASLLASLVDTYHDCVFGVSDVSTKDQAAVAIENGAAILVTGKVNAEIGAICKARDVLCVMNVSTISEGLYADEYQCDLVAAYGWDEHAGDILKEVLLHDPDVCTAIILPSREYPVQCSADAVFYRV